MNRSILEQNTIPLGKFIRAVPIVHGSVEFTRILRELFLDSPPEILACELPQDILPAVKKALPFAEDILVISSDPGNSAPLHFVVEPLEPIVESLRSSYEKDIPIYAVDLAVSDILSFLPEHFPDTYSLQYLNIKELYELYLRSQKNRKTQSVETILTEKIDSYRELSMVSHLKKIEASFSGDNEKYILFVCGIAHLNSIQKLMEKSPSELEELMNEFSFDKDMIEEEPLEYLLNRNASGPGAEDGNFEISTLSRESPEILTQPPYYNNFWNLFRNNPKQLPLFTRILLQRSAYRETVNRYERESGELVPPSREKLFFRFARNWSLLENKLLPDTYKLVISARTFNNDNFARIMFDVLHYLPAPKNAVYPEKKLTLDDLYKNSRLIRFRMKVKNKRPVPPPNIQKRFKREKFPGQWRESFETSGICSYPPEDIIIEEFGHFLQNRSNTMLSSSQTKIHEFSSSLMDGIDYRETIRNYHLGKIFVKDEIAKGMDAGSVVIIFDEDEMVYNWKMVWWGEHDQESDMAFYATPPGEKMSGPGIFQCRYGGLVMTYPPGRLHDIWTDDFYTELHSPSERLLAAAIEYNEKKIVVHLSKFPPHARMQALAGRMGQKIIHIPISTVDPVTLGRVRRFHVLDSRERRDDADDYIW